MRDAPSGLGYADPRFAYSYATFGSPVELPHSRATVLLVEDPRTGRTDVLAPYPLLSCEAPERIVDDLSQLRDCGAITFTAVLDPLRAVPSPDRRLDVLRPFKTHLLTFPEEIAGHSVEPVPSRHHRREVTRARKEVTVTIEQGHDADVDDWMRLWYGLVARAGLSGMAAAGRATFMAQFALDGALVMWARVGAETVAAQLVLITSGVAHVHLAVSSAQGRKARAMYALDATLLELLAGSGRAVHWGGVAGPADARDGLWSYKSGWANSSREAFLIGAVLDEDAYASLGGRLPVEPTDWFPAHRDPARSLRPEREVHHAT